MEPSSGPQTRATALRRRTSAPSGAHPRDGTPQQSERVYDALDAGALWFLGVEDTVRLLATCSLLRRDRKLGVVALSNCAPGVHLLHGCANDWLDAALQSQQEDAEQYDARGIAARFFWTECSQHTLDRDRHGVNHRLLADTSTIDYVRGQGTQLLSLLGRMERQLPALYTIPRPANPFGEFCRPRPVIMPLPPQFASDASNWTLEDARRALNAKWNRLGDHFAGSATEYVHVSELGVHWESIVASGKRSAKARCGFCDAAKKAIREYRREAKELMERFSQVLRRKEVQWRSEGLDADEIHERRSELKADMFPEDAYPDANAADSSADDILAHICEHDRFPLDPFEGLASGLERKNDDIFNALAQEAKEVCEGLYQPLKQLLTAELAYCGQRVHRPWMDTGDEEGIVRRELVAGLTRSGFLVGVYVMKAIQE